CVCRLGRRGPARGRHGDPHPRRRWDLLGGYGARSARARARGARHPHGHQRGLRPRCAHGDAAGLGHGRADLSTDWIRRGHPRSRVGPHAAPRWLPAGTLGELLRVAARTEPAAEAFRYRAERITYADWDRLADRAAAGFTARGVRRGDVVALLLPSTPVYL